MTDNDAGTLQIKVEGNFTELETQLVDLTKLSQRFSTSMVQAFTDATLKGNSFGATLRTLALRLSELTLKSVLSPLTDQLGSGLAGLLGDQGSFGMPLGFAKGGAFSRATSLPIPFADGGVIASPGTFPLSDARTGLAGEAGPEAILPLTRAADGSLGVRAAGDAAPIAVTFNVTATDAESVRRSESQIAAMLARAVSQGQRNL
ncbi:MAG: phage tail tape measure protein [Hyphomicrobiales bacterium]|nr:MAG: phage tail tape measure protein [Hyphomicrobiales bacterium]